MTAEIAFEGLILDLSSNNIVTDWNKVKAAGVTHVILRSSMGRSGRDSRFMEYLGGAISVGIVCGVYHFFRPDSTGIEQVKHFLDVIAGISGLFVFAVDVETPSNGASLPKPQYTQELAEFVSHFHVQRGEYPTIYTSSGEWNKLVDSSHNALFSQCELWIAAWGDFETPALFTPFTDWSLWQYTSNGSIEGINGRVDMNRVKPIAPAKFTLLYPIEQVSGCQVVITSKFGVPRDYDGDGVFDDKHEGTDFAPVRNACLPNILAGADGVVDSISTTGAYGNRVKLKHSFNGDIYYSWYCHLSRIDVASGQTVKRGQRIGVMGTTGNSSGNHLHLNLQHIGHGLSGFVITDAVDPEKYIIMQ